MRGIRGAVVLLGAAVIFTWFGVYNTHDMPILPRFAFWLLTMMVGGGSAIFIMPWVLEGPGRNLPEPLKITVTALLVSVPITAMLLILIPVETTLALAARQFGYVFVVSVIVTAAMWFFQDRSKTTEEDTTVLPSDPVVPFLERLPVKYRTAELYAISAEDHYLRVHTSLGEELILMRFGDAMKELSAADGMRTHRSWWVASEGVADSRRIDGKLILELKSGGIAAVSRTYAGAVKEAGYT